MTSAQTRQINLKDIPRPLLGQTSKNSGQVQHCHRNIIVIADVMETFLYKCWHPTRDARFRFFNNYAIIVFYLKTNFLPLETVFRTQNLLDLPKKPASDLCKEQLLPRKVS